MTALTRAARGYSSQQKAWALCGLPGPTGSLLGLLSPSLPMHYGVTRTRHWPGQIGDILAGSLLAVWRLLPPKDSKSGAVSTQPVQLSQGNYCSGDLGPLTRSIHSPLQLLSFENNHVENVELSTSLRVAIQSSLDPIMLLLRLPLLRVLELWNLESGGVVLDCQMSADLRIM